MPLHCTEKGERREEEEEEERGRESDLAGAVLLLWTCISVVVF
jgi:hypothetical protein